MDSVVYHGIKVYCHYMDSCQGKKYNLSIDIFKSNDTISYMISCLDDRDISSILWDSLTKYVYNIDNHYVFSKFPAFSIKLKSNVDEILGLIDKKAYDNYKQSGVIPMYKSIWDCKSLFMRINKERIISEEIRFPDSQEIFGPLKQ